MKKMLISLAILSLSGFLVAGCDSSNERVKASAESLSGAAKQAVGNATGDSEQKSEGKMDQMKGSLRSTKEDVKDAVSN